MLPVSASELASIQADVQAAACDKTCVIQRKTASSDGMLSETESFSTIATTIAGMRQPSGGELANYEYVIGSLAAWTVLLPVGTNVTHQDHLLINGQTLVVQVLLDPHSYPALLPVIASEVK